MAGQMVYTLLLADLCQDIHKQSFFILQVPKWNISFKELLSPELTYQILIGALPSRKCSIWYMQNLYFVKDLPSRK